MNLQAIIEQNVSQALSEDIGTGDITAALLPDTLTSATIICREQAVLCGQAWVDATFNSLDPAITLDWHFNDGDSVTPNATVVTLHGAARTLLTGERTALNFLQTLSGTATQTRMRVESIKGTGCTLLDTRKTLPGLRQAQKYAVRMGGGQNHRMGLFDAFLIKENHIKAAGGIAAAVEKARKLKPDCLLEVEVETLAEYKQAIAAHADRIMLDNFSLDMIHAAVKMPHDNIKLEVSGNITEATLKDFASTGVDYISVGAITKNVQAIDFSLLLTS